MGSAAQQPAPRSPEDVHDLATAQCWYVAVVREMSIETCEQVERGMVSEELRATSPKLRAACIAWDLVQKYQ